MKAVRPISIALLGLALTIAPGCHKKRKAATEDSDTASSDSGPAVSKDGNKLPVIKSLTISPTDPKVTDNIVATAEGFDEDGDSVTVAYQWYINGKKQLGEISDTLRAGMAQHGDTVSVEAVASDGKDNGKPRTSTTLTIRNSSPVLANQLTAGVSLDGFRMEVTDPDNDPITYKLEGAPPNMTVDASGTLHWTAAASDKEADYTVTLTGEDGKGGSVAIKFPVHLTPGGAPAAPPPPPVEVKRPTPAPEVAPAEPVIRRRVSGQPREGAAPPPEQ